MKTHSILRSKSTRLIAFLLISSIFVIQLTPNTHAQDNTTDTIQQANHPDDHTNDWYFIIFPIAGIVLFLVILRKIKSSTMDRTE